MAKKMHIPMWKRMGFKGPLRFSSTRPRLYSIWSNMCTRAKGTPGFRRDRHYKYYAHVTICEEWRKFETFYDWSMEHGYSDDRSIDRIDGSKGYTPDNCRWATRSEQNKNRNYTESFREAARRNMAKARAALKAMREARKARR